MFIKVEPAEFFMFRVQLIFDLAHPDPEDQPVRDYLGQHDLEPRHRSTGDVAGRPCDVMEFGGCYLEGHLEPIARLQRQAVEVELLSAEIRRHLEAWPSTDAPDAPFESPDQARKAAAALVGEFHHGDTSFQPDANGELAVSLDGDAVRDAARRWLADRPGH